MDKISEFFDGMKTFVFFFLLFSTCSDIHDVKETTIALSKQLEQFQGLQVCSTEALTTTPSDTIAISDWMKFPSSSLISIILSIMSYTSELDEIIGLRMIKTTLEARIDLYKLRIEDLEKEINLFKNLFPDKYEIVRNQLKQNEPKACKNCEMILNLLKKKNNHFFVHHQKND